eukprot:13286217-Ditylum_brightwellii.AAC.1
MKNGTAWFNLHTALITPMKHMQQRHITSTKDEISTGDTFSKAFATKQDYKRDDPPLVTIFLTVLSNLRMNTIKYDDRVFNCIGHHAYYIRPDHFCRNNLMSPVMVFGVHSILVCIEDYETEVDSIISRWPAPQNYKTAPSYAPETGNTTFSSRQSILSRSSFLGASSPLNTAAVTSSVEQSSAASAMAS